MTSGSSRASSPTGARNGLTQTMANAVAQVARPLTAAAAASTPTGLQHLRDHGQHAVRQERTELVEERGCGVEQHLEEPEGCDRGPDRHEAAAQVVAEPGEPSAAGGAPGLSPGEPRHRQTAGPAAAGDGL